MVAGVAAMLAGAELRGGAWRPAEPRRERGVGGHGEVQRLTLKLGEGSLGLGEVGGGRDGARRRRRAAEDAAQFAAPGSSLQARTSKEGEGNGAQLRSCSPELGTAWRGGNRRRPARLGLGLGRGKRQEMAARVSGGCA